MKNGITQRTQGNAMGENRNQLELVLDLDAERG
jgi:hypothetical protein